MRKQLRVFAQPFRKAYRHHRTPRLLQISNAKRHKAKQEFRRLKTISILKSSGTNRGTIDWSPQQLERIWRETTG